jgi:IS1 family transposase
MRIWAFCYAKQRNVPDQHRGTFGYGDVWTWTAICADTKLVPSWLVGERTMDDAWTFMQDLKGRLASRVQLTTDGHRSYLKAVQHTFGDDVDFAMLHKIYGAPEGGQQERRYSPPVCTGTDVRVISGDPHPAQISTSYVERQNLTMRMGMRRFTRLTNGFSRKVENLAHAVSLHYICTTTSRGSTSRSPSRTPTAPGPSAPRRWPPASRTTRGRWSRSPPCSIQTDPLPKRTAARECNPGPRADGGNTIATVHERYTVTPRNTSPGGLAAKLEEIAAGEAARLDDTSAAVRRHAEQLEDATRERDRAIFDSWKAGTATRAIAEATGLTYGRVQQIIDKAREHERPELQPQLRQRRQDRARSGALVAALAAHRRASEDRDAWKLPKPPSRHRTSTEVESDGQRDGRSRSD